MSALDVLLGLLATAAAAAALAVAWSRRPSPPIPPEVLLGSLAELGSLKSQVESVTAQQAALAQTLGTLHLAVQGVESKVLESSAGVRDALGRDLQETRVVVERLKADAEVRRQQDEEVQASTRRIETILAGSGTRGAAGENILEDALRQFPPGMIESNFRVNGKVVEYALILANARRLPIDSKWPSPDLLDRLAAAGDDPGQQLAVTAEIERVLRGKVREVRQYVDPAITLPWAIAAVPDAVFHACRKGHLEAYREGVILMPYSITIPYVLALFRLHLQYARSIDIENLEGHLQQIEDRVNVLDRVLENSVARGSSMIQNAFAECKRTVGEIRGSLAALRAVPLAEGALADPAAGRAEAQQGMLLVAAGTGPENGHEP